MPMRKVGSEMPISDTVWMISESQEFLCKAE